MVIILAQNTLAILPRFRPRSIRESLSSLMTASSRTRTPSTSVSTTSWWVS